MSFRDIGLEIGTIVEAKNASYGNSFHNAGVIMRILYPDGIPPEKIDDALTVVRMVDKLGRIANAPGAFGEDPYADLAGYAILAVARARRLQEETTVPKQIEFRWVDDDESDRHVEEWATSEHAH